MGPGAGGVAAHHTRPAGLPRNTHLSTCWTPGSPPNINVRSAAITFTLQRITLLNKHFETTTSTRLEQSSKMRTFAYLVIVAAFGLAAAQDCPIAPATTPLDFSAVPAACGEAGGCRAAGAEAACAVRGTLQAGTT